MRMISKMFIAVLFLSSVVFASDRILVEGSVYYKMPDGEIVFREATLDMPTDHASPINLTSGDRTVESHAYFYEKKNGRTVFYIVFLNPPTAPEGTSLIFKGTYVRDAHYAFYDGEFFTLPTADAQSLAGENAMQAMSSHEDDLQFGGSFFFFTEVTQQ
ncbi:MAG: hypothetical protein AB7F43_07475 [Bacteriovoracia bacterium]